MFKNESALINLGKDKKHKEIRKKLLQILDYALRRSDPYELTKRYLKNIDFKKYKHIYVIGSGKGTYRMAVAAEKVLSSKLSAGFINIPAVIKGEKLHKIKITIAGHPLPTKGSILGAQKIVSLIKKTNQNDLVLGLFSGGASALMCLPVTGVTLDEQVILTKLLLKCGADINEVNVIRKHLSQIKGCQLATFGSPAKFISLYLSDVVGDDLSTVACGPTVPDTTTYADSWRILNKYALCDKIPTSIKNHIQAGMRGIIKETPKYIPASICNITIGSHKTLAEAAYKRAKKLGFNSQITTTEMQGNTELYGRSLIKKINQFHTDQKTILIATGETTFKVRTSLPGGRNQQMGLAVLPYLKESIYFVAFDSDGVDGVGPEKVGGIIIDYNSLVDAKKLKLNLKKELLTNNSYNTFKSLGGLIKTGYVGTNLGDIILIANV